MDKHFDWIDCAKAAAIIAVLIDHTNGYLYSDHRIANLSYYSVSLFIFLSGITSWYNITKNTENIWKALPRRLMKIILPYIAATAVYLIFINQYFDWKTFVSACFNFTATPVFYFILIYIQLILAAPVLFCLIELPSVYKNTTKLKEVVYEVLLFLAVSGIAVLSVRYTYILPVHGGGQFLFGGSYLILFLLGMIWGKYAGNLRTPVHNYTLCLLGGGGWICFHIYKHKPVLILSGQR